MKPGDVVQIDESKDVVSLYSDVGSDDGVVDVGTMNYNEMGLVVATYKHPTHFILCEILVLTNGGVLGWTYTSRFRSVYCA